MVLALWFRTRDFVDCRPNLHKERISCSDDLIQCGTGREILEVLASVGDSPYTIGELLFFVIGKFPENARGEWGLRQKKWRGALENSSHWVVVRNGVVREDRCIEEEKVGHQAGGRKDVVRPCFAICSFPTSQQFVLSGLVIGLWSVYAMLLF